MIVKSRMSRTIVGNTYLPNFTKSKSNSNSSSGHNRNTIGNSKCYTRNYSKSVTKILSPKSGAGAGLGNVKDQMLPGDPEQTSSMYKHLKHPKTVNIIGCPMTFGQPYVGTDFGPKLLRKAGLLKCLASIGWRVHDNGDLDFESVAKSTKMSKNNPKAKNSLIVGKGCEMVANAVIEAIDDGTFPLLIGGDHSIAAGSLAGLLKARPNTGVIWVDAHADLNIPELSDSGNMHGMPVGLLMKGMVKENCMVEGFEWLDSEEMKDVRLNPDSIVYIGLRDVDANERVILREKGIKSFTMFEVDKYGIGGIMEQTLDYLLEKDPDRPLHLSYDIDAVDAEIAQATGTPVRGGLTFREAHYVAEAVARSANLASAEIVELNPTLSNVDEANETVNLGLGLVTSLMGKSII